MKLGYPNNWQKRSIRILFWFFFLLVIAAYHHALAQQPIIEGCVTKVSDGDTIQVTTNIKLARSISPANPSARRPMTI